jgi:UMF1 family MFS transporter
MKKNRLTKEERSWILYDCANSAYSIAITTALLPIVFGMFDNVNSSMSLGYFNSIASIIVAVLSPILGTIADYKDRKKRFFLFFFITGVIFTAALAFVPPSSGLWQILIIFYILTAVGFSGANIFYDSFLVDVTTNEKMDKVSTRGFAFGYISSVIPFAISLGVIFVLGMDKALGYSLGFIITALWWGLLTIPMIRNVKQKHYVEPEPKPIQNSFKRLGKTFKNIRKHKYVFIFLIAYFLYIDGVDTIIKMAVPYTQDVLGAELNMYLLLGMLFVVQIIAFPFAIMYGVLAKKYSARSLIITAILTYIVACTFAFFMTETWHLLILGGLIGTAQGGIQALSRSFYAKLIPKANSNEFFGFYNIFGKFAAIVGPALMALTTTITGQARYSIFALVPLFIAGFIVFISLPKDVTASETI